jgi:hypothetical protein
MTLLNNNPLSYKVAMLDILGFVEKIKMEYSKTNVQRNRIISTILKSDKDGRNVKGNIDGLQKLSRDKRYNSFDHKEQVKKDYETLI